MALFNEELNDLVMRRLVTAFKAAIPMSKKDVKKVSAHLVVIEQLMSL